MRPLARTRALGGPGATQPTEAAPRSCCKKNKDALTQNTACTHTGKTKIKHQPMMLSVEVVPKHHPEQRPWQPDAGRLPPRQQDGWRLRSRRGKQGQIPPHNTRRVLG